MSPKSQASAPPLSRVARRRAATRQQILHAASVRFAADGLDGVRLDQIADAADVARATLYSHFPSKEALVCAIVRPALETAAREAAALAGLGPRQAIDSLLALYLELWHRYPDALRIAYRAQDQGVSLGNLRGLHARFLRALMRALDRAQRARLLRLGDAALAAHTLARVAVPLLELYRDHPDTDRLFVESLRGLLLRD
jgi:AcrR family transcriptional regulator